MTFDHFCKKYLDGLVLFDEDAILVFVKSHATTNFLPFVNCFNSGKSPAEYVKNCIVLFTFVGYPSKGKVLLNASVDFVL